MAATSKKPVRVWSCDRKLRYGIVAESWQQLHEKIDSKFSLGGEDFSVVLEEDGTLVDESFWESVEAQKRLMIVRKNERWQPAPVPIPNFLSCSKDLTCDVADTSDTTDAPPSVAHHTIHMFIELQNNPAALALLNLDNLELIKDIDLDEILNSEGSYGLDKEFCKKIQDMSIELYVKRRTESEAMEYINLLKESQVTMPKP
ncbi:CIDE-N domain [Trinorchestia longiramus]|nr:CIDE-N domain [Trinorchestia longiramus]